MSGFVLSQTALNDLDEIVEYIAADAGIDRALAMHSKFLEAFRLLATSPGMGRTRVHLAPSNIRWWLVVPFHVAYRCDLMPIRIERIIHGAREVGLCLDNE